MSQNTRRERLYVFLAMSLLQVAHQYLFGDLPNTDEGMLLYHGAAALADFYLIYVASEFLTGELGLQIQCLSLASMVTNAFGYFAYVQYVSHWFYDLTMWGVSGVLIIKLLWIPSHVDTFSCGMVWNSGFSSHKLHNGKAGL